MANCVCPRVSIITDNLELADFFFNLVKKTNPQTQVSVFSSRKTNSSTWPVALKTKTIDLRSSPEVEELVGISDLVISIHSKQLFPPSLFEKLPCLNIHPGFNPINRGWYPQVFALINGTTIGATIHVIDEQIDHGPIIAQTEIDVSSHDTSYDVYRKVLEAEKKLIVENLASILAGNWTAFAPKEEGNYNSLGDFKALCELNVNQIGSLKKHIDLLRSLTHPPFKNAYFIDENGNKVFVEIKLTSIKDISSF